MDIDLMRLFATRRPYGAGRNRIRFFRAMKRKTLYFFKRSPEYRAICKDAGFTLRSLKSVEDLRKLPVIPTLYFKRNHVGIRRGPAVLVTSSGTGGSVSRIRYTAGELCLLAAMAANLGRVHRLFSLRPVHYIMLGYQPVRENRAVISKTAYLSTWYAPGLDRTYALEYRRGRNGSEGGYRLNLEGVLDKLVSFSSGRNPIRIVGFPSYTCFLLRKLKEERISCRLPAGSMVMLGGGWKQFAGDEITKEELYSLIWETLGVGEDHVHEFFGAAEHPVLYCSCRNHHFHIPAYANVLIRDVKTLKVLPKGRAGLVNLMTPIGSDLPLMSVMTDDIGVLYEGKDCGCGIEGAYLKLLGRTGVKDVKTCAAGAAEYWRQAE